MVAWDGSCAAAAGHGLLFVMVGGHGSPVSSLMRVWVV